MKYLLDTSTCIFYLRGKLNLDEIIREKGKENCSISEITIAELRFGAENSQDPIKSNSAVDNFLNGITIIPIISSLRLYAKEKVRLRKLGKPMNDEFDLLIGVTAVQNKMKLITDNIKDFENIKDIDTEN
jgi:tRNA(fMet)-specific endonuclease VapC